MNYVGYEAMDMGFNAHLTLGVITQKVVDQDELYYGLLAELSEKAPKMVPVLRKDITMFNGIPAVIVSVHPDLYEFRNHLDNKFDFDKTFRTWIPHISLKVTEWVGTVHIPNVIQLCKPYVALDDRRQYV